MTRFEKIVLSCLVLGGACQAMFARTTSAQARAPEFPAELVDFDERPSTTVFKARGAGHWDVKIRERGWIMKVGATYRMWFTGYDGTREGKKLLGYATSPDGVHWERHDRPIYTDHWVEDMMVLRVNGIYYMFAEGRGDQSQLLTSKDGVHWTRRGPLDVRQHDGRPISPGPYGTPTAFYEAGLWYLFYERRDAGVWLATSKDMKVWTNVRDEPVLKPGPAAADRLMIALNQIIKYKGRYYAYYHGSGSPQPPRKWASCIAVSDDLRKWTKYAKNPLRPIDENKSSGILIVADDGFRLYTMHDRVDLHRGRPASPPKTDATSR